MSPRSGATRRAASLPGMYHSVILVACFVAVAALVQAGTTAHLDRFGIAHLEPLAGGEWAYLTVPADPLVTAGLVGGAFLVLRGRDRTVEAYAWWIAFAAGVGIEVAGKLLIDQTQFNSTERVFDLFSLPGSFPSGHAMRAILLGAIASSLWPRLRAWAFTSSLAIAVAVELTGAHVVSDVVGGVLAGTILAVAVCCVSAWHGRRARAADGGTRVGISGV
jgi:membrane-associated phospholipid phosphatase